MRCPWWAQVTAFFLACVCSVSSPQADTCGFNPPYVDRLLHSISIYSSNLSCVSSSIPSVLLICSHSCFFDSSLPFFHNTYFSYPLPTSFLYGFTFLMKSLFLFSSFVSPEHISFCCTCHPLYSEIFEIFSYRSIVTVSLQDVLLTSYIPLL